MNRAISSAGWENVVVSSGGRLVDEITASGGRHVILDVKSKNPFSFFRRASALERLLRAEAPDVVCVHSRVPAWLFARANRRLRLKWISFAHGANSVSRYSRIMTAGDLVVTPSQFIADYLKNAYSFDTTRIRVIPRAIDSGRFDPQKLDTAFVSDIRRAWGVDGSKVIMGVGRITQLKGYDILIRALAHLRSGKGADGRSRPDYRLVIVGEAEKLRLAYAETLRRLASRLGVSDAVVFAGAQSKVAECLSVADVVVSSNYTKPEAFGRSMAEALAMNKPVVATAFGGALDIVRDGVNGALVAEMRGADGEARAAAFADAIRRVLDSDFGNLRADALERFSYALMVERSLDVYRELACSRHGKEDTL